MKKLILLIVLGISLGGCSSFSIDREINTPFGKVDANYDSWMGTDSFSLENNGIKLWK